MGQGSYRDQLQAATEVVEFLLAEDWEQLGERSTPKLRELLEREGTSVWHTAQRGKGSYQRVETRLFTPEDESPFEADFTLRFERGSLRIRVAVDAAGLIAGLVVRPGDWA